jgi:hypothetical protein
LDEGWISSEGKGKATAYLPSPKLELSFPIDLDAYFLKEQAEFAVKTNF